MNLSKKNLDTVLDSTVNVQENTQNTSAMSLIGHVQDLRTCFIKSFAAFVIGSIISYIFSKDILNFLIKPLAQVFPYKLGRHLIYTDLSEAFLTHIKIATYGGTALAFPVILFQLWKFIVPGLYRNEKKLLLVSVIFSPVLFLLGMIVVYYGIFPLAWSFFLSFQDSSLSTSFSSLTLPLEIEPRISSYLDLSLSLMRVFGICFQLPLILAILVHFKIIHFTHLKYYRRHAIVTIFSVAAVLTPPDIFSQLLLALPLIVLYELSIVIARFLRPI